MTTDPNPLQALLRRNLGVDAFSLDGDATETQNDWSEKRAKTRIPIDAIRKD